MPSRDLSGVVSASALRKAGTLKAVHRPRASRYACPTEHRQASGPAVQGVVEAAADLSQQGAAVQVTRRR